MKTRIACLFPLARVVPKEALELNASLALKIFQMVKDKDTEIVPCFPEKGVISPEEQCYRHLVYRQDMEIYEAMIQIEKDGYDGIMIFCWNDPALFEARQALDIPVVGAAQSSILFAHVMGRKFGLVTLNPTIIPMQVDLVERYALKERLASVKPITIPLDRLFADLFVNSRSAIEDVQKIGRACIADGAEVLLIGCMAMAMALTLAPGCEKDFPNGLTEVDGVPIVNNLAVMVKAIESMVTLKRAGLPWISRKCSFARPAKAVEDKSVAVFARQDRAYFTL